MLTQEIVKNEEHLYSVIESCHHDMLKKLLTICKKYPDMMISNDHRLSRKEIDEELQKRLSAKQAKNWKTADRIRDELWLKDVEIADCKDGSQVATGGTEAYIKELESRISYLDYTIKEKDLCIKTMRGQYSQVCVMFGKT